MGSCGCDIPDAKKVQRAVLWVALALNAAMFIIGGIAGLLARSSGLLADALDMLADASAYGIAIAAIARGAEFKRRAALLNGILLMALGAGVLLDVIRRALGTEEPITWIMAAVATLSLGVNSYVLYRLIPFRKGEVHLRATWLFTRADVIASICVILSAGLVAATDHRLPDLLVGTGIGCYVMKEAWEILRSARRVS